MFTTSTECRNCHREIRTTNLTYGGTPEWRHLDGFVFCDPAATGSLGGLSATPHDFSLRDA